MTTEAVWETEASAASNQNKRVLVRRSVCGSVSVRENLQRSIPVLETGRLPVSAHGGKRAGAQPP